jgi:hypothetical protein
MVLFADGPRPAKIESRQWRSMRGWMCEDLCHVHVEVEAQQIATVRLDLTDRRVSILEDSQLVQQSERRKRA